MILVFLTLLALCACVISVRARSSLSAQVAELSRRLSHLAKAEPLTASQLVELSALNDAVSKANALLKKISQREVMRDRRESTSTDTTSDKDALRRRAGILPGRPAPHQ